MCIDPKRSQEIKNDWEREERALLRENGKTDSRKCWTRGDDLIYRFNGLFRACRLGATDEDECRLLATVAICKTLKEAMNAFDAVP
jgi:hypothetical protein